MSGVAARKVVFAPDLIGGALVDPECARALEMWRDGVVMPVVSRELLRSYLRLLDRLGVTPRVLARWTLWFTSPGTAVFLEEEAEPAGNRPELRARTAGKAELVIYRETAPESRSDPTVLSAKEFLAKFGRP